MEALESFGSINSLIGLYRGPFKSNLTAYTEQIVMSEKNRGMFLC